ncbi:fatty acid desaturase [Altericroceibacterium endophyticum]|uniref:Beta-carotene hydroxylase n=1 Tax=Altericroceibacterium endophyticum TaxID=1808508 RepID=A0A6I4T248_9SPHN|nr:fatty acid desaturase [Altericroceibacterium endophyticum]MXO64179.1 beta-carotene hydroxylase [Altericroceibacterium endophyticum]
MADHSDTLEAKEGSAFTLAPQTDQSPAEKRAIPLGPNEGLDKHTRVELLKQERVIADKYYAMGQTRMWMYVAATLVGFTVWVALFPLTIMDVVPLPLAFILSYLIATGGYVTAHEAMHSTIGRKGTKRRFWNELVGQLSMVPLMFPFSIARATHIQHHKFPNDPVKDPDYPDSAPNLRAALVKAWLNRQPGPDAQVHHIKRVMLEEVGTPEAKRALKETVIFQIVGHLIFIGMALAGYAIEVALVWWLPRWCALIHTHVFFSWETHYPHSGRGRYDNTRIFRSSVGSILSMWIEFHLIHHLYPNIPMHLTKPAYFEMKPVLEQRGVDCSAY